jgi:hypothetical protein
MRWSRQSGLAVKSDIHARAAQACLSGRGDDFSSVEEMVMCGKEGIFASSNVIPTSDCMPYVHHRIHNVYTKGEFAKDDYGGERVIENFSSTIRAVRASIETMCTGVELAPKAEVLMDSFVRVIDRFGVQYIKAKQDGEDAFGVVFMTKRGSNGSWFGKLRRVDKDENADVTSFLGKNSNEQFIAPGDLGDFSEGDCVRYTRVKNGKKGFKAIDLRAEPTSVLTGEIDRYGVICESTSASLMQYYEGAGRMHDIGTPVEFAVGKNCLTNDGKTVVFDVWSVANEHGFGVVMETSTNSKGISGKILRVDRFDSDCHRLFAPLNRVDVPVSKDDFVSFQIEVNRAGYLQATSIRHVQTVVRRGCIVRDFRSGVEIQDHESRALLWAHCEVCEDVFRVGTEVKFWEGVNCVTADGSRVVFAVRSHARTEEAFGIFVKTAEGTGAIRRVDVAEERDTKVSEDTDISTFSDGAYVRYKKVEADGIRRAENLELLATKTQSGSVSFIGSGHGLIRTGEFDAKFVSYVCRTNGRPSVGDALDYHVAAECFTKTGGSIVFKVWRPDDCVSHGVGLVHRITRTGGVRMAMILQLDQLSNQPNNLTATDDLLTASSARERDVVKITKVRLADGRWRVQELSVMNASDVRCCRGMITGEGALKQQGTNVQIQFNPLVSDEDYPVGTVVDCSALLLAGGPLVLRVHRGPDIYVTQRAPFKVR